jgi:hypothetical protein
MISGSKRKKIRMKKTKTGMPGRIGKIPPSLAIWWGGTSGHWAGSMYWLFTTKIRYATMEIVITDAINRYFLSMG